MNWYSKKVKRITINRFSSSIFLLMDGQRWPRRYLTPIGAAFDSIRTRKKKGIPGDPDISINKTTQHREQKGSNSNLFPSPTTSSIRSQYDPRLPLIFDPRYPISAQREEKNKKKKKKHSRTIRPIEKCLH